MTWLLFCVAWTGYAQSHSQVREAAMAVARHEDNHKPRRRAHDNVFCWVSLKLFVRGYRCRALGVSSFCGRCFCFCASKLLVWFGLVFGIVVCRVAPQRCVLRTVHTRSSAAGSAGGLHVSPLPLRLCVSSAITRAFILLLLLLLLLILTVVILALSLPKTSSSSSASSPSSLSQFLCRSIRQMWCSH